MRKLFKNSTFTSECVAAAYLTGIIPIKKLKSQSAISDFREYTALAPGKFAEYIGFNENDIRIICNKYDLDIEKMKHWYDGYTFGNAVDIYNPYSVMRAADMDQYAVYKKAGLHYSVVNGRQCLVKNHIDWDYIAENETKTNRQRLRDGNSPFDKSSGTKIELHHMRQEHNAPFVELTVDEHKTYIILIIMNTQEESL